MTVADTLLGIGPAGAFAVGHSVPARDLRLEVAGVGAVVFPVSKSQAVALCRVARPARHGLRDRTVLDPTVRDTWEIPRSKLRIDRSWAKTLEPALRKIERGLGLAPGRRLRAELHNLLVYAPGQFFVPHQDSEKSDGMLGTLVVTLPCRFKGGALIVRHHDEELTFRGSAARVGLAAFYADCHHEVRPVQSGYRIVLTYNLLASSAGPPAPVDPSRLDALEREVRAFFRTAPPPRWQGDREREAPDRLVYLLDHQYTPKGLGWAQLKNADAARTAALQEIARRLDCEIVLALADVHESWSCEDDYDRGYRGRRWGYDEHEDEEEDGDGTPALLDLIDSSVELRHFVDATGRGRKMASAVAEAEILFTKPSHQLPPFQSEHEGYMGNWGNTVDRWYHRAAVVLWPKSRSFAIRAKASASWGIGEIAKKLARGRLQEGRAMASEILPFWSRVAGEAPSKVVVRTLRVIVALEDPGQAAALLAPFRVEHLSAEDAPALAAVVDQYGLPWFRERCARFVAANVDRALGDVPIERRLAWLSTLPRLAGHLCSGGSKEGLELADWIAVERWRWLVSELQATVAHARPSELLKSLRPFLGPVLAIMEASFVIGAAPLHREIVRFLVSGELPPLALVALLRAANEGRSRGGLRRLDLGDVHAHAVKVLEKELRAPARAADDWSIAAPSGCGCSLCLELAGFLGDRSRRRYEWPLAKDRRAHVHHAIDSNELPVTHVTRRSGSPYTLVLEKTGALFEREAKARAAKAEGLAWLARKGRRGKGRGRA